MGNKNFINQLLVIVFILLAIPIILSFYLFHMAHSTELGMLDNQNKVVEKAVDELDRSLKKPFGEMVKDLEIQDLSRRDQEKALNQALKPMIDKVKENYPNVEIGFYSIKYDVVLDGNNLHLHENFSTRKKKNFNDVLDTKNMFIKVFGGESENGQLEVYQPLIKNGKTIGIIWANTNIKQIYKKVDKMKNVFYGIILVGTLLAFGGTFSLINKFVNSVEDVKKGINTIANDHTYILPRAPGELGEITDAVNHMSNKLLQVQNYNNLILTNIDDGIITIDVNRKIISFNLATSNVLGLNDECLGKKIEEVFLDNSPFYYYFIDTLNNNKPFKDVNVIAENKEGESRNILISTSLMINPREDLVGALLHFRDITELIRLREKVNRQEKLAALGKLVAGVAHEIRSPLTSITGYMQFWGKGHVPSEKSLNLVNRELNRITIITEELLQFARPSKAVLQPYNLNVLVQRCVKFFADVHGGDIEITYQLAQDLPAALMDSHQIEKVLSNVMYNALQAMGKKGCLDIHTFYSEEKNMLGFAVKDDGCGIPDNVIKNIFEPFFTTKSKGTGLGLAIAQDIIYAHNGFFKVESSPDKGTVVKVFLPIAEGGA